MSDSTRVSVLGGNGYVGSHVVKAAVSRGYAVTSLGRSAPSELLDGVAYVQGDAADDTVLDQVTDADAVIAALSPRGPLAGHLVTVYQLVAERTSRTGARLIVVGGFGGMRPSPGAPRFVDGDMDPRFAREAREMVDVLDWLTTTDSALDWVFVSPGQPFGSFAPGEPHGHYRLGGDVVSSREGVSETLSGADFALALVDLVDADHHREHLSVTA